MKLLSKVVIGLAIVVLVGCNYRYLRTKPTTFVAMDKSHQNLFACMDAGENFVDMNLEQSLVCDGYITADYNKIKETEQSIKDIASKLFYISNRNCKRFIDRFYYNNVVEDSANQFLGIKVFNIGFGINLQDIGHIPQQKFHEFENNLQENMQGRKKIKERIEQNLSDANYTKIDMLSDFIEYDRSCSLVPSYEDNSTK